MKTVEERIQTCRVCENRKMDMQTGIVCGLTNEKPTFDDNCPDFKLDEKEAQHYLQREDEVAEEGGAAFAPEQRGLRGGVLGGLAMMVIAVVWFVVGWQAGRIFFYPPVLFVIGLVGLIRGIAQGNMSGEKYRE